MNNRIIGFVLTALAIVLLGLSCTHKPYHPTKDDRQWAIDHKFCEKWAREGIRDDPDTYDHFDEMRIIRECMKRKGWQWERTSLFNFSKETDQ